MSQTECYPQSGAREKPSVLKLKDNFYFSSLHPCVFQDTVCISFLDYNLLLLLLSVTSASVSSFLVLSC